jgi:nitrite reductase (NO-forming)
VAGLLFDAPPSELAVSVDTVPPLRHFAAFGGIMTLAIAVGAAIGVAIFGFPGLPPATAEHRIPIRQPDEVVEISLQEFSIGAVPVVLGRGDIVEFAVTNDGSVEHDFKIDGTDGVTRLAPGSERSFQYGPVEGTTVIAWCTILGHRENGMEITLEVVDRPEPADGVPPGDGPPTDEP